MKRQEIKDERVIEQRRKVSSEVDAILMMVLLVSIFVQQFFQNAPFKQYAVEFMCFFGISFYKLVRYMTLGLYYNFGEKREKMLSLINSLATGLALTVVNGVSNYSRYSEHYLEDGIGYFIAVLAITFISGTGLCYIVMSFFSHLNKVKQDKIQKKLDEDEDN